MTLLAGPSGGSLPSADRPTAVWGVNDRVATGVLLAALRLGLDVPGDLSVMGMDDQEDLADRLVPALTTLALPHRRLGGSAVSGLLEGIEQPERPRGRGYDACPARSSNGARRRLPGSTGRLGR